MIYPLNVFLRRTNIQIKTSHLCRHRHYIISTGSAWKKHDRELPFTAFTFVSSERPRQRHYFFFFINRMRT